jgi:multidrug efflux system outer membrane protein
VRTGFADVDNSLSQHDSYQNMATEQDVALQKAESIQKSLQLKYKLGAVSYADTIGAQLDVDYVRSSNNQTKIQQMGSIVQLYQALGGGYDVKPVVDQK